jgi:formylglycine-generating enzyme required for sulfatase activity
MRKQTNKYKKMKKITQLLILAIALCSSAKLYAQVDYSFYLQVAEQCLSKSDCTRAEENYNVWKSMTGKTNQDLARRIEECKTGKKPQQANSSVFTDFRETANNLNIDMVAVRGGTFTMGCTAEQGSDCEDDEKPAHTVTVSDFYIGKYEVTQAQWVAVMGSNPSYFIGDNHLPVERVSWDDLQEFIRKLNTLTGKTYRLPTEAEWEFAARGGNKSAGYKYSGSNNIDNVTWYDGNRGDKTHAVGSKSPNELGIYDMSGNVYEWCSDWYGDYSSSSQTNPKGSSSGSNRVLRGGSWYTLAQYCRVSFRSPYTPSTRNINNGFRLCLVP